MSSIRGKNTKPEIKIRKLVWAAGKRYRIHDKTIYGTPDLSNKKKKLAVFIDGCFWHGCNRCYKEPASNIEYWRNKIISNKKRRIKVRKKLKTENWHLLEFWEHEVNSNPEAITRKILELL